MNAANRWQTAWARPSAEPTVLAAPPGAARLSAPTWPGQGDDQGQRQDPRQCWPGQRDHQAECHEAEDGHDLNVGIERRHAKGGQGTLA
jgi:hypothetical protein